MSVRIKVTFERPVDANAAILKLQSLGFNTVRTFDYNIILLDGKLARSGCSCTRCEKRHSRDGYVIVTPEQFMEALDV